MAISERYQRDIQNYGIVRKPEMSDDQFVRWLNGCLRSRSYLREAKAYDVPIVSGMTINEIHQAINDRFAELLAQKGIQVGGHVNYRGKLVEIREIGISPTGRRKLTVKYWTIAPWDKPNNQGRLNHTKASAMLHHGVPVS